jgi:large subunit ribosomal protein L24
MALARIKKDDLVVVIAGKDKGAKGRVMAIQNERGRVIVEGVNKVKRHMKPTPKFPSGGIIEKEMSVDLSNVMLWDEKAGKGVRVRAGKDGDGKKVRVSVKTGDVI